MIQAEVATTLDRSQLTTKFQEASMLNAQAYYQVAPWTFVALMKLHNLEQGNATQSGVQRIRVSEDAVRFARTVLADLKAENVPIPGICPAESGDIAMTWTVGLKQVEAIFGPDRLGTFVVSNGDKIIGDGDFEPHDTVALCLALEGMMAD